MAAASGDAAALLESSLSLLLEEEGQRALLEAKKARALFAESGDKSGEAEALRAICSARLACLEVEAALVGAQTEVERLQKAGDTRGEGLLRLSLADVHLAQGNGDQCLAAAEPALSIFSSLSAPALEGKARLVIARAQLLLEAPALARKAAELAAGAFREAGDRAGEASALQQLAVALAANHALPAVVEAIDKALALYREANDAHGQGSTLNGKAELHLARGRVPDALAAVREALQIFQAGGFRAGAAASLSLLVQIHLSDKAPEAALQVAELELAKSRKARDKKGEAAALHGIFQVRITEEKDPEVAAQAGLRAVAALCQANSWKGAAQALHSVAVLQFERGYWELCVKAAREAVKIIGGGPMAMQLETLIVYAREAQGCVPASTSRRSEALKMLESLREAMEAGDVEAFEGTLKRLKNQGGFTEAEALAALQPVVDENPEAGSFLEAHMVPLHDFIPNPSQVVPAEAGMEPLQLRGFPAKVEFQHGRDGPLEWHQTQGSFTIMHLLTGGPHEGVVGGWLEEDMVVEMTLNKIKVTLGGDVYKELTKEFLNDIWVKHSWWTLVDGWFTLHVYKRALKSWECPWYDVKYSARKKVAFTWRLEQKTYGDGHGRIGFGKPPPTDLPEEKELMIVKPGAPEPEEDEPGPGGGYYRTLAGGVFAPQGENYVCSAQDICLGYTVEQTEKTVVIHVHFERDAYEEVRLRYPMELVFAADVWEQEVCIFIQGDKQNPMLWGRLAGTVTAQETRWRLASAESMRRRQSPAWNYSPVLEVKLSKTPQSCFMWEKVFEHCQQHPLMVKEFGEKGPVRHEGLRDAKDLTRAGFDLQSTAFWSHVDDYISEHLNKTGASAAPRPILMAG